MSRLIDADEVKNRICIDCRGNYIRNETIEECRKHYCGVMREIDNSPTVDAVEVVRCKDCKYLDSNYFCNYMSKFKDKTEYCSFGKVKE